MKIKKFLVDFGRTLVLTFIVYELVLYVYGAITNDEGYFNWGTLFRFAITACIVLPLLHLWKRKEK
jgi:hypothetical protein